MEQKIAIAWKHRAQGAAIGAVLTVAVGFSWFGGYGFGWTTGGKAAEMARKAENAGIVKALLPICLANFQKAPDSVAKLTELKKISSMWARETFVRENKWAVIGTEANSGVIDACAEALNKL